MKEKCDLMSIYMNFKQINIQSLFDFLETQKRLEFLKILITEKHNLFNDFNPKRSYSFESIETLKLVNCRLDIKMSKILFNCFDHLIHFSMRSVDIFCLCDQSLGHHICHNCNVLFMNSMSRMEYLENIGLKQNNIRINCLKKFKKLKEITFDAKDFEDIEEHRMAFEEMKTFCIEYKEKQLNVVFSKFLSEEFMAELNNNSPKNLKLSFRFFVKYST